MAAITEQGKNKPLQLDSLTKTRGYELAGTWATIQSGLLKLQKREAFGNRKLKIEGASLHRFEALLLR